MTILPQSRLPARGRYQRNTPKEEVMRNEHGSCTFYERGDMLVRQFRRQAAYEKACLGGVFAWT
jgi:hypothetical protein